MPKINVNGLDLWYESSGDGYIVIFLHAFAVTSAMWFSQVVELSKTDFQVVCVDLRGHGLSSAPPAPYTLPQLAKDVHELIQYLASSKVALVGLSTGGRVATRVALDYPNDVSKLVLVSTKSEPAVEIKVELDTLSKIALNDSEASAAKLFHLNHYQRLANAAPSLMKTFEEVWFDKPGNGFAGVATAISTMESVTKRIAEIQVPTMAIAGELDPPCHPYLAWYERSMANCQGFIVPESGHFVNVERPELFNQLLSDFL
jgi:pimeloyl-ACP methyl ester carboxylesterase